MPSSGWREVSYPRKLTTSCVNQEKHHGSTLTRCTVFTATLRNVLSWTAIPKVLPLVTVKSDPQSVLLCCHYLGLQLMHLPRSDFAFLPICQFSQSLYCYLETLNAYFQWATAQTHKLGIQAQQNIVLLSQCCLGLQYIASKKLKSPNFFICNESSGVPSNLESGSSRKTSEGHYFTN